jgi:hypothetical protein
VMMVMAVVVGCSKQHHGEGRIHSYIFDSTFLEANSIDTGNQMSPFFGSAKRLLGRP